MSDAQAREEQHPASTSRSAPLGSAGRGIKSTLRAISGMEGFGVVAAMLGLCLFLTLTTDTFMTQNNLVSVLRQSSYIGIMAVGSPTLLNDPSSLAMSASSSPSNMTVAPFAVCL